MERVERIEEKPVDGGWWIYIHKELRHLQEMEQQVQPQQRGWVRGI